ncbi:LysM peptidoglycan-binding domain-containing protein [Janibacter cremeus]|uniref:LysM peptidoglycan-binding domain-containing protein n=1 Tax=Janibacter cremeus TaxID=1285192 RepID=UPI0023F8912B|nr:LysM peptidoglycan-binding domain-containing protein [Janibacter cremeus]WEV78606.1 LysM peptidoglycan-binding domain-containing protein [Janibacter cremeus]
MTALTVTHGAPVGAPAVRPTRTRHLHSVPTGDAVAAPAKGAVRLTRRGRLTMTLTTLAVASVAGAGMAFGGPAATPQEVTVEQGQTLTSIAAVEMTGVPTDDAIAQIRQANDLATSHVHAGQTLVIPTP